MNLPPITERQHATILAALRSYQRDLEKGRALFENIASNDGKFKPLTAEQIDVLCERIN